MSSDRKVDVQLTLDLGDLPGKSAVAREEFKGIDKDVEQLAFDFGELDNEVSKAGRQFIETAAEGGVLSASLKLLGGDAQGIGKQFEGTGNAAANALQLVDKRVEETRTNVKRFADDFNKTGAATSFDLWKSAEKDLKGLERIKRDLTGALKIAAVDGGKAVANGINIGLQGGIKGVMSSVQGMLATPVLGPVTAGAVIAVAVSLAPVIGAAISAALVTGLGLAGIGLGIAGAIQSPLVKAAGAQLGRDLKADLADVGAGFVGPLSVALSSLDKFSVGASSKLGSALAPLASMIVPLEHGLEGLINKVGPGLRDGLARAQPLISLLAADLPQIGTYFSDFIEKISASARGNREGLQFLISTFGQALEMAGNLFEFLSHGFAALVDVIQPVAHVVDAMFGWVPILGGQLDSNRKKIDDIAVAGTGAGLATDAVSGAWRSAAIAIDNAKRPLGMIVGYYDKLNQDLAAAAANFDKVFGITIGVAAANDGLAKSMIGLSDGVKQNGDSFTGNSPKALANRDAVRQVEQAILAVRDANVAAGMKVDQANAQYSAQEAALRAVLKQYNLSDAAINAMVGDLSKVPQKTDVKINTPGLGSASAGVADLNYQLGLLHDRTIHVQAVVKAIDSGGLVVGGNRVNRYGGIYESAAEGKLRDAAVYSPTSPARYAFAESATGGEGFVPRFGDYRRSTGIIDHEARWYGGRFAPSGGGGGGGGGTYAPVYNVTVNASPGTSGAEVGAQVVRVIKRYEQANGTGWRN